MIYTGLNEGKHVCLIIDVLSCSDFQLFPPKQGKAVRSVLLLHSQVILSVCRYQYYLQLKKDVLEGRITCSLEQAVHLASLAVQGNTNMLLLLLLSLFWLYNAGKAELSNWHACFQDSKKTFSSSVHTNKTCNFIPEQPLVCFYIVDHFKHVFMWIEAGSMCAGLYLFSSSPSHDMSSNFCPGRRISNTAGKVISGTAIYWPGCWHSRTAEITYCQSSVQMTSQTVHHETLCKLESPSRVVVQTFPPEIKLFCFHFVTVAIMC